MNKFFKSAWFKCVAVLLAISIIAGGLLAILNDVLYVSADERTSRALKKIYGYEIASSNISVLLDVDQGDVAYADAFGYGSIQKIYQVTDNGKQDMLFRSTGTQGYKGGTITLWVKVEESDNKLNVTKVIVESFEKQTLMSKLDGNFYAGFYTDITDVLQSGEIFSPTNADNVIVNPVSGATMSANAACNAVNTVLEYIRGLN